MALGGRPFGKAPFGGSGFGPVPNNQLIVQIGDVDVTPLIEWPKFRIRKELSGRDELDCELISATGYIPPLGDEVAVRYQGGVQFIGSVHERDAEFVTERSGLHVRSKVRCVDVNEIADRRIVAEVYENQSTGDIVSALVTKYLLPEGIHHGDIQAGPRVTRVVFSYRALSDCLDELCEQSGFVWNIDTAREMNYFARTTSPAPFPITSANAVFRRISGSRTRNQYRNIQYLDGGRGVTDARTEHFRGDGVLRTFHVEYPLFDKPSIERNFQSQTVGIRGVDSEQQWYWNSGETGIGQDPLGGALVASDRLSVTYRGTYNLRDIVEDTAAVLERQAVEGGTGKYEQLDQDDAIDGQDVVREKGLSLIRRFASLDDVANFDTDIPGLDVGQLATLDVPELQLVGSFLITDLEISWLTPSTRRFSVKSTTGELKGRFQDFFKQLLGTKKTVSIREGEILHDVLAMREHLTISDSIEATLVDVSADAFGAGDVGTAEMGP